MPRILLVEDEQRIAAFVSKGLTAAGLHVEVVTTGPAALDAALGGGFDLVLLDLGLPGMDGMTVLERLRGGGSGVPVIALTARDSADDMVAGFDLGLNDYVTKPFRFDVLLARVRARLQDAKPTTGESAVLLRHGDLELDLRTRRIDAGGRSSELSSREFALAEAFLRHPDQVLSREQLLSTAWGIDFDPGSNVVDVYVRYLRQKIGAERLETVRGAGYRLVIPAPRR